MASFIILSEVQADTLRESLAEITPRYQTIQRAAAHWILPESILRSPAHAAYFEFLGALPSMDSNDPAFPPPITPIE